MSLRNRNKTFDWARFGGIEEDESLDKVEYELEIKFPIMSVLSNNTNNFVPVNIKLTEDLFIVPPASVYSVDWGDSTKIMYNFREYTADWNHTYTREAEINKDNLKFRVVILGHNLVQRYNNKGTDYIHQIYLNVKNSVENGLIIVRSVTDE